MLTITFSITLTVFPAAFFVKPYDFWNNVFPDPKDSGLITSYHILVIGLLFNVFDTVGR